MLTKIFVRTILSTEDCELFETKWPISVIIDI